MRKLRPILALIGASLHPVDERPLAAKKQNGRPEAARSFHIGSSPEFYCTSALAFLTEAPDDPDTFRAFGADDGIASVDFSVADVLAAAGVDDAFFSVGGVPDA